MFSWRRKLKNNYRIGATYYLQRVSYEISSIPRGWGEVGLKGDTKMSVVLSANFVISKRLRDHDS